jgi:hypothetical protein
MVAILLYREGSNEVDTVFFFTRVYVRVSNEPVSIGVGRIITWSFWERGKH